MKSSATTPSLPCRAALVLTRFTSVCVSAEMLVLPALLVAPTVTTVPLVLVTVSSR